MKTLKDLKNLNIEKVASAIEADAGQAIPVVRESLAEVKAGVIAQSHTPEQIQKRGRGH